MNVIDLLFLVGGVILGVMAIDSVISMDDDVVSISLTTASVLLILASGVISFVS